MTQTNRILVAVVAAVVAGGAFYMFALKPKREELAKVKKNVAAAQSELAAAQQLLAANERARATYRQAYSTVVRLGKAVPADDDVRSLMVQLDAAARKSGVDFRTINVGGSAGGAPAAAGASAVSLPPGVTVGSAGFPVMPFSFNFTGGFFKLSDFFDRVQTLVESKQSKLSVRGRLMQLDSFELAPDSTGFPNMRASVQATSYLVSPLEGATGGATAAGPAGTDAGSTPAAPAPSGSAPAPTTATSTGAIR